MILLTFERFVQQPLPPPSSSGPLVAKKKRAPPPPPITQEPSVTKRMEDTEETSDVVLRDKPASKPTVRVSIGTYHSQPEPSRLDYLTSSVRSSRSSMGNSTTTGTDSNALKNQLQSELTQTLSRARQRQRQPSQDVALGDDEMSSKSPPPTVPAASSSSLSPAESNQSSVTVQVKLKKAEALSGHQHPTTGINKDRNSLGHGGSTILSTFGRSHRQPSIEIQAKIASLAAGGANAPAERASSPPTTDNDIRISADNKVTIKVNPYFSISNYEAADRPMSRSSIQRQSGSTSPHFGST